MYPRRVARFTREEAMQKIGHKIRSLVEFSGVPLGTRGSVVDIYEVDSGCFDVVIKWDFPVGSELSQDRFAKDTYERLLTEEIYHPDVVAV